MKRVDYTSPATTQATTPSGTVGNVQEVTFANPLKVSVHQTAVEESRPRVLAQRRARQTRRFAH